MAKEAKKNKDPVWSCTAQTIDKDQKPLNVGDKYGLICKGDFIDGLESPLKLEFKDSKNQYSIHILNLNQLTGGRVDFVATSYKPGKKQGQIFFFTDKMGKKIQVNGVDLEVATVIEQKQGQPAPKPFGPKGPYELAMPWWYYLFFIVMIVVILSLLSNKTYRIFQRKKLKENLSKFKTAIGAYNQFNKEWRTHVKSFSISTPEKFSKANADEFVEKLRVSFSMYIVREFKIPAMEWSVKNTLKDLKKYHFSIYVKHVSGIMRLTTEFEKASGSANVNYHDCEQISFMTRDLIQKIHQSYVQGRGK